MAFTSSPCFESMICQFSYLCRRSGCRQPFCCGTHIIIQKNHDIRQKQPHQSKTAKSSAKRHAMILPPKIQTRKRGTNAFLLQVKRTITKRNGQKLKSSAPTNTNTKTSTTDDGQQIIKSIFLFLLVASRF